jgi:ribosomal protein L18E
MVYRMDEERSYETSTKQIPKTLRLPTKRNPKLNVLRLQKERRYKKIKGKRHLTTILAVRDQDDTLVSYATTESEENDLRNWYEKYNKETPTEKLPISKKVRREITAIKRNLKKRGFIHSITSYGTARNKKTGKWEYKRMEIFKATPWTTEDRRNIRNFFKTRTPKSNLAIFVLHQNKLYMHPATATS